MMLGCNEIKGTWYGVKLPSDVRVFDCRVTEQELFSDEFKVNGRWPLGSERVACFMGMPSGQATTPSSMSGCGDLRKADDAECARVVADMVKEGKRLMRQYRDALANPPGQGQSGSVEHKPMALVLSNYGWGVMADRDIYAVRAFNI